MPKLHLPNALQMILNQMQAGSAAQAQAVQSNPVVQAGKAASTEIGQKFAKPILDTVQSPKTRSAIDVVGAFAAPETRLPQVAAQFLKGGMSEIALREVLKNLHPSADMGLIEDIAKEATALRQGGESALQLFKRRLGK